MQTIISNVLVQYTIIDENDLYYLDYFRFKELHEAIIQTQFNLFGDPVRGQLPLTGEQKNIVFSCLQRLQKCIICSSKKLQARPRADEGRGGGGRGGEEEGEEGEEGEEDKSPEGAEAIEDNISEEEEQGPGKENIMRKLGKLKAYTKPPKGQGVNLKFEQTDGYFVAFCSLHTHICIKSKYVIPHQPLVKESMDNLHLGRDNCFTFTSDKDFLGQGQCNIEFIKEFIKRNKTVCNEYENSSSNTVMKLKEFYRAAPVAGAGAVRPDVTVNDLYSYQTLILNQTLDQQEFHEQLFDTYYRRLKDNLNFELDKKIAIIMPYFLSSPSSKYENYKKQALENFSKIFKKEDNVHLYIMQQNKEYKDSTHVRFNRGFLLNVGFQQAYLDHCNIFIFHDIDLKPNQAMRHLYLQYPHFPMHIGYLFQRYRYEKYFGGVNSFSSHDFLRVNGFPNNFFGWGGEDDALRKRLSENHIVPRIPDDQLPEGIARCETITERQYILADMETLSIKGKLTQLTKENAIIDHIEKERLISFDAANWRSNGVFNTNCCKGEKPDHCYYIEVQSADEVLDDHLHHYMIYNLSPI